MRKLLLLMPEFMQYEMKLKDNLETNYEVTWVNCDQYDKEILNNYRSCSKLRWMLRNSFSKIKERDQENIEKKYLQLTLQKVSEKSNYYSVVFCINGSFLADEFYFIVKKRNPNARFIFYAWDDISNLFKQSHIKFFHELYAYNIRECKRYNFIYLPMFVQDESSFHNEVDEYDILFVGSAHSDRQKIADDLYEKYGKTYRLFIYLYDPNHTNEQFCHDTPLPYEQYINNMRKSKALLDVPQITQEGPTTRAFDALLSKTKVITANSHITEYPIYSDNILIVDRNNIVIDKEFMDKSYQEIEYKALTIPDWLLKFNL